MIFVLESFLSWNLSCAHFVEIPRGEFDNVSSEEAKHWRIRTTDGKTYSVARYTLTDSTLTIEEFDKGSGAVAGLKHVPGGLPHSMKLEHIAALEKIEDHTRAEQSIVLVALGLMVVTVYLTIWLSTLDLE